MEKQFEFLTMDFLTKATVFPGSVGTFRYRIQRTGWLDQPDASLQAWVYENVCFELAQDVETEHFPWTEEGVACLRAWLARKLEERGSEPYRIPWTPKKHVLEPAE